MLFATAIDMHACPAIRAISRRSDAYAGLAIAGLAG
jgi:hypothetical protein